MAQQGGARQRRSGAPRMSPFWIGFLATIVPILGLGVLAAAFKSFGAMWFFSVAAEVLGFFVAIVLSITHVPGANGVWTGLGIGLVSLGVTCFAAAV